MPARMLDDGLLRTVPKPDYALALHVDSHVWPRAKSVITPAIRWRTSTASTSRLRGRGGHGAFPHTTIDPIVQAAQLILDLQTIVSREIKPTEPAVITVGSIHGGTKHNIIGDECHLQLTVRSFSDEVRQAPARRRSAARLKPAAASADAARANASKSPKARRPCTTTRSWSSGLCRCFAECWATNDVVPSRAFDGGRGFQPLRPGGRADLHVPLGSVDAKRLAGYARIGQEPPSLHSAVYYPDAEPTLETGVTAMASAALELLQAKQ